MVPVRVSHCRCYRFLVVVRHSRDTLTDETLSMKSGKDTTASSVGNGNNGADASTSLPLFFLTNVFHCSRRCVALCGPQEERGVPRRRQQEEYRLGHAALASYTTRVSRVIWRLPFLGACVCCVSFSFFLFLVFVLLTKELYASPGRRSSARQKGGAFFGRGLRYRREARRGQVRAPRFAFGAHASYAGGIE